MEPDPTPDPITFETWWEQADRWDRDLYAFFHTTRLGSQFIINYLGERPENLPKLAIALLVDEWGEVRRLKLPDPLHSLIVSHATTGPRARLRNDIKTAVLEALHEAGLVPQAS